MKIASSLIKIDDIGFGCHDRNRARLRRNESSNRPIAYGAPGPGILVMNLFYR